MSKSISYMKVTTLLFDDNFEVVLDVSKTKDVFDNPYPQKPTYGFDYGIINILSFKYLGSDVTLNFSHSIAQFTKEILAEINRVGINNIVEQQEQIDL